MAKDASSKLKASAPAPGKGASAETLPRVAAHVLAGPPAPSAAPSPGGAAVDLQTQALVARMTASLSPAAALQAWLDWAIHLAASPGKRLDLASLALTQHGELMAYLRDCMLAGPGDEARALIEPPAQDGRFSAPAWRQWPFNLWHQSFLLRQQWWEQATRGVRGVSKHHENMVAFAARQWLDMFSPGNRLLSNPVVLQRTLEERGANLLRGSFNALGDARRAISNEPPVGAENFRPGHEVAVTPGKVVLRNQLIELIQYTPTTAKVRPEPILLLPAWIMKYYILDLSPHNSLVRYLVEQGYTVFCVSWKNPGTAERDLGMDDYLAMGVDAPLDAIDAIVPGRKVHAAGYCLGGTLLAIAAAAMARDGRRERLATVTLFTAQTDFSEPGELALFIDESQVSMLEAQMAETGYLSAGQMAGAFQLLRSYDLLWSRVVSEYLLGDRRPLNDLMAWNADGTRMPAKMHSQYLRRLFLDNDLSASRYPVRGRPVSVNDVQWPLFCVATESDHVAPWRSVYKLHYLTDAELTFVLASGGHNAGIVSEPGHPRRHYHIHTREFGELHLPPEEWATRATDCSGSWWTAWKDWLDVRSGRPVTPPRMGLPGTSAAKLADAPGSYVLER